ncbi:MAG: transglutaminase-like domain-containing protein [Nitrospinota bacterium]|nr:transglutaminase-like domain-containing protein [Nitrospinota bacterium]
MQLQSRSTIPEVFPRITLLFLTLVLVPFHLSFAEVISEEWMEIKMNSSKIGFTYQKVERTGEEYKITSKSLMKFEINGITQEASTSHTFFLDSGKKPKSFTYMQKMLNHRQFFDGIISGNTADITIRSGGNVSRKKVPFPDNANLADAISYLLGDMTLETGAKYKFHVFVESLLAIEAITIEVGKKTTIVHNGKKEEVFEVQSKFQNFTVTSFLTPNGRTLKEISPLGFTSESVDEKQALSFKEGVMPFTQILAFSLIPVKIDIEKKEEIAVMVLHMSGLASEGLIPSDSRQKVKTVKGGNGNKGKTIILEIEVRKENEKEIPKIAISESGKGMEEYLKSTFEAQSDDPAILKRASRIAGKEKDTFKKAQLISRWVHKNVKKSFIDTFSAVETLRSLEGECQSHTNLFAALARAEGIPVRTVSGIVYSEDFEGFLYHAWPEIYAGKWIAIDPTLGQEIADVTHVKLIEGELSKQLQLFEFIGKIGIEIKSIERSR